MSNDYPDLSESSSVIGQLESDNSANVAGALEALLLLAAEPVTEFELAQAVGVPESVVSETLAELVAFYEETGRGFELRQVAGGWRYYTREEHADLITRYVTEGQQSKLSQAALETLAVVAYTQPISRGRVSAVRGVNVDGVMRTLLARGLLEEAGQRFRVWCFCCSPPPATSWNGWACNRWMICRRSLRSCLRWRSWRLSLASWAEPWREPPLNTGPRAHLQ